MIRNAHKLLGMLFVLSLAQVTYGQARIMINNDAYVTMAGGTAGTPIYVVVDNGNANAISTLGTGGNIVSEGEFNKVKWNLGTNTGAYTVPFYSQLAAAGQKIPLTVNITSAGTAGTGIDFSTYRTSGVGSGANTPLPSMVTHFTDAATGTVNNELFVVDRFWMIDAQGYTIKPDADLTIVYDNSAAEISSINTITETNLVAQRFNSTLNAWEGQTNQSGLHFGLGTLNTGARTIGPFSITAADFFEAWVLVDRTSILPVQMLDMNVICEGSKNVITWSTATETDNDYFTIYRSSDAVNFTAIGTVQSIINSSITTNYSYTDQSQLSGMVYYKIEQTDKDGTQESFQPLSANCSTTGTDIITHYSNGQELGINIQSGDDQDAILEILDAQGKLVYSNSQNLRKGLNQVVINHDHFAVGVYSLRLSTPDQSISRKVFLGN